MREFYNDRGEGGVLSHQTHLWSALQIDDLPIAFLDHLHVHRKSTVCTPLRHGIDEGGDEGPATVRKMTDHVKPQLRDLVRATVQCRAALAV